MASFNAEIALRLKTEQLDRDLKKVEQQIGKLGAADKAIPKELTSEYNRINKQLDAATDEVIKRGQAEKTNTRELKKQNAELRKQKTGRRKGFQSAALGVGFPLLFGGGAGSVLGGLAGSAGGFGGQILGSAIGQQIDNFVQEIGKLGQALNALTPDVDALVKSAGLAGTATGELIKSIEKAEGAQVAQAAAAELMAAVVGVDGVNALRDAGSAVTDLGNEASKAFSALSAALAPALEAVASFLAKNLQEQRQLSRVDPGFLGSGAGDLADNKEVLYVRSLLEKGIIREEAARTRILNIVRDIEAAETKTAKANLQTLRTVDTTITAQERALAISETEKQIAELGGDIRNKTVYALERQSIELAYQVKIQDILNEEVNTELDKRIRIVKLQALANNRAAELADLENRRNKALTGGGSKPPESKALQLQQQLIREDLKRAEIKVKYVGLIKNEETAIQAQQLLIQRRLQDETKIIELQRQQALAQNKVAEDAALINELSASKLETLKASLALEQATNDERLRAIRLEKELQDIKNNQKLSGIATDLTRQIEDTQFRIDNPFGGDKAEQMELETAQARRYADAIRGITEQEELLNAEIKSRLASGPLDITQQNKKLDQLAQERALYEQLLPQLNAVEQAELRMAQNLEKLAPVTDALASGLADVVTSLVDGTKSAEEALSAMFKNIGAAFIQMATEMIAKAIVMKALGILMPGAGSAGGFGVGVGDVGGVSNNAFGILGMRADGGPVGANRPYMVGERGPELFVPNNTGTVVSNEALGRYNGGNGTGGGGSRTINFQSEIINNVEYVTASQAMAMSRAAADDGAKRGAAGGHAKTMNTLQNNRSSRSRIGMR